MILSGWVNGSYKQSKESVTPANNTHPVSFFVFIFLYSHTMNTLVLITLNSTELRDESRTINLGSAEKVRIKKKKD